MTLYLTKQKIMICILASMVASPFYANAGTISSVGGASVKQGRTQIGARVGYSTDNESTSQDRRIRSRFHVDYGVSDLYAARVVVAGDKRQGDNLELDTIGFQNRLHILKAKDHGFDFGARVNYVYKDGDKKPDNASVGFYQGMPINDKWALRFNQLFSHDIGQDAEGGVSAEVRTQITYKVIPNTSIGIDSFNDFGRINNLSGFDTQDHDIGPVIKGKLGNGLSYETGYRVGVSDAAADHSFKFFLSKSF
jgi:hypothetical protein